MCTIIRRVWSRQLLTCPGSGGCGAVAHVPIPYLPLGSWALASHDDRPKVRARDGGVTVFLGDGDNLGPGHRVTRLKDVIDMSAECKKIAWRLANSGASLCCEKTFLICKEIVTSYARHLLALDCQNLIH